MNAATRADAGNGDDDDSGGPGCTHRSAASSSVRTAQAESSTTASGSFAQLLGIEPGDLPIEQGLIVRDLALIGRDELDPLVAGEGGRIDPASRFPSRAPSPGDRVGTRIPPAGRRGNHARTSVRFKVSQARDKIHPLVEVFCRRSYLRSRARFRHLGGNAADDFGQFPRTRPHRPVAGREVNPIDVS